MAYTLKDKAQLYHQLFTSYKAGLPLSAVLDPPALPAAFRNKQTATLPRLLAKGRPMSAALLYVKAISPWESQVLATGEEGGRLEVVLRDLDNFFTTRQLAMSSMKAKLLYPLVVLIVGTLAGPLPALVAGKISLLIYLFTVGGKCLLLYGLYQLVVVWPFEKATGGAFNPVLLKLARRVSSDHWIRQLFEVSYLNLLTLCLEAGIPVDATLKLLRDSITESHMRGLHTTAISQVQNHGTTLTQTLTGTGILRNYQIISFLSTAEQSGTLHSDLRQYFARRRGDMDVLVKHKMTQFGRWLYFVILLMALAGYF